MVAAMQLQALPKRGEQSSMMLRLYKAPCSASTELGRRQDVPPLVGHPRLVNAKTTCVASGWGCDRACRITKSTIGSANRQSRRVNATARATDAQKVLKVPWGVLRSKHTQCS